jgi:hypothetical protein
MSALMILGMNRERHAEVGGPNQHWRKAVPAGRCNQLTAAQHAGAKRHPPTDLF